MKDNWKNSTPEPFSTDTSLSLPPLGALILPGSNPPVPFEQEIFLFDTFLAGTSHLKNRKEVLKDLKVHEEVRFFREPENPYDSQAIRVERLNGKKIGYIPRADNVIFARLMDAGKWLYGRIQGVEKKGNWDRISLGIFLKD